MRLVSFAGGFGRVENDHVVPMGPDLAAYLEHGEARDGEPRPLAGLPLLAPVPNPQKIIGIGRNYAAHADERDADVPDEPILFAKFANSLVGDDATVAIPPATSQVDWEAELGVVIGRRTHRVDPEEALAHVGGYTCLNDFSARDLQLSVPQWTRGKAIDGFLPAGPWLVTPDELGDPHDLAISCTVNGEVVQQARTDEMVFKVGELISVLSQTMTLLPGDYIATGTPAGVGIAQTPPRFLKAGDVTTVEIERIGTLTTVMG